MMSAGTHVSLPLLHRGQLLIVISTTGIVVESANMRDVDDAVKTPASDLTDVPNGSDRSLEAGVFAATELADASLHAACRPSEDVRLPRPRLGVFALHPIQYHAPLYQRLASRGQVQLDVLFLRDTGSRYGVDPGFGVPVTWNIDLLSGYEHSFLDESMRWARRSGALGRLVRWLRSHEVVVISGYSDPWMLFAAAACRTMGVPFLLRGMSAPEGLSTGTPPSRPGRHRWHCGLLQCWGLGPR